MNLKLAQKVLCFICAASMSASVAQPTFAAMAANDTAANETIETPAASETPEATEAPEATEVPEATETPDATEVPEATETPEATEVPEATETPEATEVPEATETPEATEVPEATEAPEATELPEATETPEATEVPSLEGESVFATLSANSKTWFTLKNNGAGGHNYGKTGGPVTALYQGEKAKEDNKLSLEFRPTTDTMNFGIFYYYLDDSNWLYVGYDPSSGWYYQYKVGGKEEYPKISGLPTPAKGETMDISISLGRETMVVNVNGVEKKVTNQNFFALSEKINAAENSKFGVMTKSATEVEFANAKLNDQPLTEDWKLLVEQNGSLTTREVALVSVSGQVLDGQNENKPMEGATVRAGNASAVTDKDGKFTLTGMESGTYSLAVTKPGYQALSKEVKVENQNVELGSLTLQPKEEIDLTQYDYIQSNEMRVYVGKDFPVVAQYQLNYGSENPLVFQAQSEKINEVSINGVNIVPEVTNVKEIAGSAAVKTYDLALKNAEANIDVTMTVRISVEGNDLTWEVTKLERTESSAPIAEIEVPNLNLVTVTDLDAEKASEAQKPYVGFAGAGNSTVTTASGDVYIGFNQGGGFVPNESAGYLYGFLTNGQLSAGLWSNSEAEGDKRVQRNNSADSISLTSSRWYYERGDRNGQKYATNHPGTEYPKSDLPCAKVSIATDLNKDNQVDWNDGAIAFRDIMNMPMGAEDIKDMANYRIVMNFASMAPNPYLETADNIKKVFLATDGLPQAVMLKGYGNEGHDSANSEYADIAEREGGVDDFRDLIKIAHEYNTEIGIHVNAQEAYPESKSFSDEMVGYPNVGNGWGWLDQSHVIDKLWDLSSQNRWKRFVQLYDRINETEFLSAQWPVIAGTGNVNASMAEIAKDAANRPDNMDFIYLDVWYQDAWETRRIADEINALGWRFSTEFSAQGEYDSTWNHWSTDAVYGGASMKGYNSEIIRFLRNDHRDSQVLNYPEFGGTADNPLLGGYRLVGFEGWGGDKNFNSYIEGTFNENLPTRFLQHYKVTKWQDYSGAEGDKSPVGNKEKQITLMDDQNNVVVVTRNPEQREDTIIERTITLNGKVVLNDDSYLLPWEDNQGEGTKLYHWNYDGGETTWDLTDEFAGATSLVMYELSDQGRINPKTVMVNNGQVTLNAKAKTAYILVKNPGVKDLKADYGEKDYVVDPGFNGYTDGASLDKKDWSGDINNKSVFVRNPANGDQELVLGETGKNLSVSTKINGLTRGEHYVAEIYVNNDSDSKATVSVNTNSKTESNYTYRSIASNYVKCDEENGTNMQWIQVPFVADSDSAVLTLSREAGSGEVMWDDIRIVKIKLDNYQADGSFKQDFESVTQGLYPFVLASAQGVSDPSTHLSQLHAPYTQSGWHTKILDDVIEGNWSLKHHSNNRGIIYRTIPQNFRFEPGKVYEVSFDYQVGQSGAYAMVVGDGAESNYQAPEKFFDSTAAPKVGEKSTTAHHTMTVTGSASGQTWIGLYCNGQAGDNAMGGKDFILDNLVIREVADEDVGITLTVSNSNPFKGETVTIAGVGLDKATFTNSNPKVAELDEETGVIKALSAGETTITAKLGNKMQTEASVTITVVDSEKNDIRNEDTKAVTEKNTQSGYGLDKVLDNKPGTNWDRAWDKVTKANPAIGVIDLGAETKVDGFAFLQRTDSNQNGRIQGYRYVLGNKLDENNLVVDGKASDWITVDEQHYEGWVEQSFENLVREGQGITARYIQIEVYGKNNNASIAEFKPYAEKKVADTATVEDTTVYVGQSKALEAVAPENTLLKGLVWSTEDTDILAVTESGVMTGLKEGVATVTVTNAAGLKATGKVTVEAAPPEPLPNTEEMAEEIAVSAAINLDGYKDGAEKDAFVKALAHAKEVQNNPAAYTQNDVDTAKVELTAARLALKAKDPVLPPDITALEKEIATAVAVDLSKYQDGAEKTNFVNALNYAKEIQSNPMGYTQAEVNKAVADLQAARLALKPVDSTQPTPTPTPTPAPGQPENPSNPSTPAGTPQTGDSFNVIGWVVIATISAGCVVVFAVLARKKHN